MSQVRSAACQRGLPSFRPEPATDQNAWTALPGEKDLPLQSFHMVHNFTNLYQVQLQALLPSLALKWLSLRCRKVALTLDPLLRRQTGVYHFILQMGDTVIDYSENAPCWMKTSTEGQSGSPGLPLLC